MSTDDYTIDLAFSFLGQDESLAWTLHTLLKDRVSTFIYSDAERQKRLAGRDGEEAFARVFGSEARTVAVLYRDGWGQKGFTAVESTAIRNRAIEQGYEFVTFVPLDRPAAVPLWLPRARLWIGLERWGIEHAATVLESRVQASGGVPRSETADETIARTQRELRARSERDAFLNSEIGVRAMRAEFDALYSELDRVAKASNGLLDDPDRGNSGRRFGVKSRGFTVVFDLEHKFASTTRDSKLEITEWDGPAFGLRDPSLGSPAAGPRFASIRGRRAVRGGGSATSSTRATASWIGPSSGCSND